ncbi:MAG: NTP transferase domain-containing protein, partial [Actinobacteria bacterium]|nr:NTP transferase domain-containing protein [Actinomycetota bacterium]
QRLPNKNLARLDGKSLVRRALETAVASRALDVVVVSSDDDEILEQATGLDVRQLRRPDDLATPEALAVDVVRHAVDSIELSGGHRFDAIAVVQCTAPFTEAEDIDGTIELLRTSGAPSAASVSPLRSADHPLKMKRIEGDRLVPWLWDDRLAPAHELPQLWVRNGSVYACTRSTLDQGRLIDDDCRAFRMPEERALDIDTPIELAFAEFLWDRRSRAATSPSTDLAPEAGR